MKPKMEVGIDIVRLDKPEIIPWVWRIGGEDSEKRLELILQSRITVRSQEVDWAPGTVGFERSRCCPTAWMVST